MPDIPFEVTTDNLFLITRSSSEGSYIVRIHNGETIFTRQKLPAGLICHSRKPRIKEVGVQYMYDICCSVFVPKKFQLSSTSSVYAVNLHKCQIIQKQDGGKEVFYVEAPELNLRLNNIFQMFNRKVTLKEYISGLNVHGDGLDCWITPIKSSYGSEWVIIPFSNPHPPKQIFSYTKLYDKMGEMFSKENNIGLGVVVGMGKIAVGHYLMNCSPKFQMGETRVCEYKEIELIGYKTMVLVKSKPVKLKRRYLQTYVTPGGNVLIKTVVHKPCIEEWKIQPADKFYDPQAKSTIIQPNLNYSHHPFFGSIFFSPKMVWSAPTLRVIIGPSLISNLQIKSYSTKMDFDVWYHIMAFHDCEKYWRVPDVPAEMNNSKNFFITNGFELLGDEPGKNPSKKLLPPASFVEPCCIEGRFLSNQFIKHPEYLGQQILKEEEAKKGKEDDDELFVKYAFLQK